MLKMSWLKLVIFILTCILVAACLACSEGTASSTAPFTTAPPKTTQTGAAAQAAADNKYLIKEPIKVQEVVEKNSAKLLVPQVAEPFFIDALNIKNSIAGIKISYRLTTGTDAYDAICSYLGRYQKVKSKAVDGSKYATFVFDEGTVSCTFNKDTHRTYVDYDYLTSVCNISSMAQELVPNNIISLPEKGCIMGIAWNGADILYNYCTETKPEGFVRLVTTDLNAMGLNETQKSAIAKDSSLRKTCYWIEVNSENNLSAKYARYSGNKDGEISLIQASAMMRDIPPRDQYASEALTLGMITINADEGWNNKITAPSGN